MENEYRFEELSVTGGRFTPIITIVETGGIGISAGFTKKYEISNDNTSAVKLMFDRNKNAIGIRFLEKKEEGSISVKFAQRGGAHINARPLWIKFDIEYKRFVNKYTPKEVVDSQGRKIYVFELKESENS